MAGHGRHSLNSPQSSVHYWVARNPRASCPDGRDALGSWLDAHQVPTTRSNRHVEVGPPTAMQDPGRLGDSKQKNKDWKVRTQL